MDRRDKVRAGEEEVREDERGGREEREGASEDERRRERLKHMKRVNSVQVKVPEYPCICCMFSG